MNVSAEPQTAGSLPRRHEIDLLKAVSIVAVVAIHALGESFMAQASWVQTTGALTRFAVPGLLFAAGFVFKKAEPSAAELFPKLARRIFPAYLFWSLLIIAFDLPGRPVELLSSGGASIIFDLFFGNAIGIYYYVFVTVYLYILALWLRRQKHGLIWILWIFSLLALVAICTNPTLAIPNRPKLFFFILFRHPFLHLFPFLSGWLVSIYYPTLRPWLDRHIFRIVAGALVVGGIVFWGLSAASSRGIEQLLTQVHVCIAICLVFTIGRKPSRLQSPIVYLSRNTYGIFLIHYPIVQFVYGGILDRHPDQALLATAIAWLAGLTASLLIIQLMVSYLGKPGKILAGTQ